MFQLFRPIDSLPPALPFPESDANMTELQFLWLLPPGPPLLGPVVLVLLRNDSLNNHQQQNLWPLRSEHYCFYCQKFKSSWGKRRQGLRISISILLSASVASCFVWLLVISPNAESPFLRLIRVLCLLRSGVINTLGALQVQEKGCWVSSFTKGDSAWCSVVWLFCLIPCGSECPDLSSSAILDVCFINIATSLWDR